MGDSAYTLLPTTPTDTIRLARDIFDSHSRYIRLGDHVNELAGAIEPPRQGMEKVDLRLALITLFQFLENLTDSQAVRAVWNRIEWKYALHLSMDHPGVYSNQLCACRSRFLTESVARSVFSELSSKISKEENGFETILPKILNLEESLLNLCMHSHLEKVMKAMRRAQRAVASNQPELLHRYALPDWYERYYQFPPKLTVRQSLCRKEVDLNSIGNDIQYLLETTSRYGKEWVKSSIELQALRHLWVENFKQAEHQNYWHDVDCARCFKPGDLD